MITEEQLNQFSDLLRQHEHFSGRVVNSTDIDHSALIRRLAADEKPYSFPPPRSFSYPWYSLLDTGEVKNCTVSEFKWKDETKLLINQTMWDIREVVRPGEEYIASWPHYVLVVRAVKSGPNFWEWTVTVVETENKLIGY